ncbi:hypothetical protein KFU94_44635 [Chloroflexi bacterium TSY]|nr:hypothetical protein [Chloroflexi bacterium TSY]
MPLFRDQTEAFVVRIWLERREIVDAPVELRGVVEHVSSGQRQYITELTDIIKFIDECLKQLGMSPNS